VNIYSVSYTDNTVSGNQAMTTITAKQFAFSGGFVIFSDDAGQSVFAVPTERNPIITFTGTNQ
jgi:hypothetical protein